MNFLIPLTLVAGTYAQPCEAGKCPKESAQIQSGYVAQQSIQQDTDVFEGQHYEAPSIDAQHLLRNGLIVTGAAAAALTGIPITKMIRKSRFLKKVAPKRIHWTFDPTPLRKGTKVIQPMNYDLTKLKGGDVIAIEIITPKIKPHISNDDLPSFFIGKYRFDTFRVLYKIDTPERDIDMTLDILLEIINQNIPKGYILPDEFEPRIGIVKNSYSYSEADFRAMEVNTPIYDSTDSLEELEGKGMHLFQLFSYFGGFPNIKNAFAYAGQVSFKGFNRWLNYRFPLEMGDEFFDTQVKGYTKYGKIDDLPEWLKPKKSKPE